MTDFSNIRGDVLTGSGVIAKVRRDLPAPRQTLAILAELLAGHIDSAERLETQIAEAADELRDCNQDWRAGILTIRLTAARSEQARQITQAAQSLKTIERLRANNEMDRSVLGRVIAEYVK